MLWKNVFCCILLLYVRKGVLKIALIKCGECGKEVSSQALSCPNCGNPIAVDNSVKVEFPKYKNSFLGTDCRVFDLNGNLLARCKQGEIASFGYKENMIIKVKMQGFIGSPKIEVEPGGRYKVNIRLLGTIGVSKVDILN